MIESIILHSFFCGSPLKWLFSRYFVCCRHSMFWWLAKSDSFFRHIASSQSLTALAKEGWGFVQLSVQLFDRRGAVPHISVWRGNQEGLPNDSARLEKRKNSPPRIVLLPLPTPEPSITTVNSPSEYFVGCPTYSN